MCFIIGFGLMLIFGGAHVFTVTRGDEWLISGLTIAMGLWCLSVIPNEFRRDGIDGEVRNKIIAEDGQGAFLVRAKTRHNILGPRTHVNQNLPAHITTIEKGLHVVDFGSYKDDYSHVQWIPVKGYHIEPRGANPQDFVKDVMEGYDHQYVVRDE